MSSSRAGRGLSKTYPQLAHRAMLHSGSMTSRDRLSQRIHPERVSTINRNLHIPCLRRTATVDAACVVAPPRNPKGALLQLIASAHTDDHSGTRVVSRKQR